MMRSYSIQEIRLFAQLRCTLFGYAAMRIRIDYLQTKWRMTIDQLKSSYKKMTN